jgi:serine/threonine protein kinase
MNAQQLNINTIIRQDNNYLPERIKSINSIINSQISPDYNVVKYLGEGIHGSLFLAKDSNNKRFICKKIFLDKSSVDKNTQLNIELNILKYLSMNKNTKDYVNPCIAHKVIDNNVYTIFPVFNGYSLNHLTSYLSKLSSIQYYKIIFHIIKKLLHGLAKIHQTNIAHQNINDNSILVSTYDKAKNIKIKFTDFGLGCITRDRDPIVNVNTYEKETEKLKHIRSCKDTSFVPVDITPEVIKQLYDHDYLQISQKYDLLALGIIFLKLLLYFENLKVLSIDNGFNTKFKYNIEKLLNDKYLLYYNRSNAGVNNSNNNFGENSEDEYLQKLFPSMNISKDFKKHILEYLKIFNDYIFCKTEKRQNCQYILDKLIIYEKYKNDPID